MFLQSVGAGTLTVLAGCTGGTNNGSSTAETATDSTTSAGANSDIGTERSVGSGGRVSITDIVTADVIATADERIIADNNRQYLLANVQGAPPTEKPETTARDEFVFSPDEMTYRPLARVGDVVRPVNAPAYENGSNELSGWLVFEVPKSTSSGVFTLRSVEDVQWQTGFGKQHHIAFNTTLQAPDKVTLGNELSYTLEVKNSGGRTGRFYRPVSVGNPIERTVQAGETVSITRSKTVEGYHGGKLPITAFDEQVQSVSIEPLTAELGETIEGPGGVQLTVSEPVFTDSVSYEYVNEVREAKAGDGAQFVLAKAEISNTSTEDKSDSPVGSGVVRTESNEYEYYDEISLSPVTFTDPVEGPEPDNVEGYSGIDSGENIQWVSIWQTPSEVAASDISLRYSYGGQAAQTSPEVVYDIS